MGRDSDSESQWQGGDSDQQTFSPSECLGQAAHPTPMIHFDKCTTRCTGVRSCAAWITNGDNNCLKATHVDIV